MHMPTVYIALPVHNRLASTKLFLECLAKQTYPNVTVVICDDGSTDGTSEYIAKQYPEVVVVQGDGELWWTGGINMAVGYILEHAEADDLVLTINNDVFIAPDYIEQKVHRAQENPGAIIGSVCVYQDNPDIIETSGQVMDFGKCRSRSIFRHGGRLSELSLSGCVEATHLPGKGVLIPVSVFHQIGIYDAQSFPHYHADTDFTLRAHESDIRVLVDTESIVHSDANTNNMNQASAITLKGIVKTFSPISGVNSFPAYWAFAKKHFAGRELRYFATTYFFVIAGLMRRYIFR